MMLLRHFIVLNHWHFSNTQGSAKGDKAEFKEEDLSRTACVIKCNVTEESLYVFEKWRRLWQAEAIVWQLQRLTGEKVLLKKNN